MTVENREIKAFPFHVKKIEGRAVSGISAVFGNIDAGGDRIFPGAFRKTIQSDLRRVKFLWQHDFQSPPIGVVKELRELSRDELPAAVRDKFPEASGGLRVVREYLDSPRADEVFQGVSKGAINEMSFGYDPVKFDFEEVVSGGKTINVRNLRELTLWDVSDVNWGMNPATVADAKARFWTAARMREVLMTSNHPLRKALLSYIEEAEAELLAWAARNGIRVPAPKKGRGAAGLSPARKRQLDEWATKEDEKNLREWLQTRERLFEAAARTEL